MWRIEAETSRPADQDQETSGPAYQQTSRCAVAVVVIKGAAVVVGFLIRRTAAETSTLADQ